MHPRYVAQLVKLGRCNFVYCYLYSAERRMERTHCYLLQASSVKSVLLLLLGFY